MTDLYDRLFDREEPNPIAVHSFRAALGDYAAGHTSRGEIVGYWSLDAEAQTGLDILLAEIDGGTALDKAIFLLQLHDVMLLTEEGAKYQTKAEFATRMGL